MQTQTAPTTDAKPATTASPAEPKTATITLTANGTTLALRAHRLSNGTAETFVTTTEGKTTTRGMTQVHSNFQAAKAAIEASATQAVKLGWTRKVAGRGFVAKPDAFDSLPKVPKAVKK